MSQFPPPPMGSISPQPPMGSVYAPPASRSNVAAIISLVCGLLFCFPAITSIAAIILGFVGISKAKDPSVRGKGMAVTGLILGIAGILLWIAIAGFGGWGYMMAMKMSAPARTLNQTYISSLAAGNVDSVMASTDTTSIDKAELTSLSVQMKSWGGLKNLSTTQYHFDNNHWTLGGTAEFATTTKKFEIEMAEINKVWKVTRIDFK